MSDKRENIKIKIFASPRAFRKHDTKDEERIADIVRKEILTREKAKHHSVKVKVKRRKDGSPKYLVVYMLRKDTYTADIVRVDVDENYAIQAFVDDYADTEDDEEESEAEEVYESVDFVVGTPVPEIPTANAAVEEIRQMVVDAGFTCKVLLGEDASVANYKNYLKSGLRGFVNIGHGSTDLIVLDDGALYASWFQDLPGKQLAPAVVYFNSCRVFNNPLQPAVMRAGARTYIGGIVNLLIGPSEEVCKCFWNKVLTQRAAMGQSLENCETDNYPMQGAHGISGDLGTFNFITSVIDKYKVVLYGEDATVGNLTAFIHCYYEGTNVMSCEFYKEGAALTQNRYAGGRVGLVYPWSRFSSILDVLRNEKPVYFGFIMSTKVGYVATHREPVGEGSDQS